jgi:hypothetical protein
MYGHIDNDDDDDADADADADVPQHNNRLTCPILTLSILSNFGILFAADYYGPALANLLPIRRSMLMMGWENNTR